MERIGLGAGPPGSGTWDAWFNELGFDDYDTDDDWLWQQLSFAAQPRTQAPAAAEQARPRFAQTKRQDKGGWVLNSVIILLVLLIGLVVIPKAFFHVQVRAVVSGSMLPQLPVGSLVIAVPRPFEDLKVGNDLMYLLNDGDGAVVTHRIVAIDTLNQRLTTQGTANTTADPPVDYKNTLGVVKLHLPLAGYPLMLLDSTLGKIAAATVFAVIILVWILLWVLRRPARDE
jgi:signal peptidase I